MVRLRGRCLAYGDGIGLWPLSEAVKQHLALTEADDEDAARRRLEAAVEGMSDAAWLRARLAPLVGLEGEGGEREEVLTPWQRFFDEIAARLPLVLVFEDLHWAHPTMLAFVHHLAEWSAGVPLLIVCTARPELFEAHPQWAGGLTNATSLAVRPLDEQDTRRLAHALLGSVLASTDAETALLERCNGNPLYAEEYARLLIERSATAVGELEMPETVQVLIAARIDTLSPDRKGTEELEPLRRGAVRTLALAAERAVGIDVDHTERLIRDGLRLTRLDDPQRGPILCVLGECLFSSGPPPGGSRRP